MKKLLILTSAIVGLAAGEAIANEPYCREFTKDIKVGNQIHEGYGTACMQPDGSWKVVSDKPRVEYKEPERVKYVYREKAHYVAPRISFIRYFNDNRRYHKHRSHYRNYYDRHDHFYKKKHRHHGSRSSGHITFSFH